MKRTIAAGALALGLGAGLSACIVKEVRVGDDAECVTNGDCGQRGLRDHVCVGGQCELPPEDPTWGCLDEPPPAMSRDQFVDLRLEVVNASNRMPRVDAVVNVCLRLDVDCATPLVLGVRPDATGRVLVGVPQDFDGYFEVFGPQGKEVPDPTFVPILLFLPPREVARGAQGRGVLVFDKPMMDTLSQLGSSNGAPFNYETGLVVLTALTCEGQFTEGVSFDLLTPTATPNTQPFYMVNRVPILDVSETDASGTGGFTTVRPGPVQLSATRAATQQPLTRQAGVLVYVRGGWYTQVYVSP